jgi:hypothetical protein
MARNTLLRPRMRAIAFEDVIDPETTLPEQFQRLWHGTPSTTPECLLMYAVLLQACDDLRKSGRGSPRVARRLHDEALRWFASDNRTWAFSFLNVCDALGLSPLLLRAVLKITPTPAARPPRHITSSAAA